LDIIGEQIQKGEKKTFLAAEVSEVGFPTQSGVEKGKEIRNEAFWVLAECQLP